MVNDIIADMLTRIRNANLMKSKTVKVIATRSTKSIAQILLEEGYINLFKEIQEDTQSILQIDLKYRGRRRIPCITALRRISKPGLRVYSNSKDIPRVLGGIGVVIVSTSQGIMTDRKARDSRLGGEVLCYLW
uniref:ribosomal protein S8 n=1 Tax=Streptofilum capillatum TaxID=2058781 RepID=UPI00286BBEE6|nr:ribosomal protein S8 [Streptofilum capillatum]WKT08558.1 ribosomal protein S8 [Streptofilum capillatum]WKT08657.1 ribosomal protein S8 [Streptofilum sp. BC4-VF8pt]WKT08756.1 ribosomal protein S8 [Streptofilum sp. ZNP2-VF4pt]